MMGLGSPGFCRFGRNFGRDFPRQREKVSEHQTCEVNEVLDFSFVGFFGSIMRSVIADKANMVRPILEGFGQMAGFVRRFYPFVEGPLPIRMDVLDGLLQTSPHQNNRTIWGGFNCGKPLKERPFNIGGAVGRTGWLLWFRPNIKIYGNAIFEVGRNKVLPRHISKRMMYSCADGDRIEAYIANSEYVLL